MWLKPARFTSLTETVTSWLAACHWVPMILLYGMACGHMETVFSLSKGKNQSWTLEQTCHQLFGQPTLKLMNWCMARFSEVGWSWFLEVSCTFDYIWIAYPTSNSSASTSHQPPTTPWPAWDLAHIVTAARERQRGRSEVLESVPGICAKFHGHWGWSNSTHRGLWCANCDGKRWNCGHWQVIYIHSTCSGTKKTG